MRELWIGDRRIADDEPCYVIAEIGHNHGGSVDTARKLIHAAASCGVDAVKFQKRDIDRCYTPELLAQPYENPHSFGATYGAHRRALEFGTQEFEAVDVAARAVDLPWFATPFDEASADFLRAFNPPAFKMASAGLTDGPLLSHVASFRLPILLSTGGSEARDIDRAIIRITDTHTKLAILHCTAAYPVLDHAEHNLRCIETMRTRYPQLVIGWSGHDSGIAMALVAYTLGARIIEQHVTLNRASKGTDHAYALEPVGLRKLVRDLQRAHLALGDGVKRVYASELQPLAKMRRRLTPMGMRITGECDRLTAV